jgi:hypothetical protein
MVSLQSLDIVIGMVVVFVTVSLVCSSINELIASTLALRANTLKASLDSLLGSDLAKEVLNHPAIPASPNGQKKPSYIEPTLFASALLDTVAKRSLVVPPAGTAPIDAAKTAIDTLAKTPPPEAGSSLDALSALLRTAGDDYTKFQTQVAGWFDAYMDRVGGAYKRNSQVYLAVIAIFVVGILNIDSVKIFEQLTAQPAVAAALVAQGQKLVSNRNAASSTSSLGSEVDTVTSRIQALPFPLGWHKGDAFDWLQKLLGLLITMIAASLGAPFWFAALSNLVNLRSTGDKPGGLAPSSNKS